MGAVSEGDPIAISSSIALLQERFKQLRREKMRREERELLRLFSYSPASFGATYSTGQYINRSSKRRRLFHNEFLLTDRQPWNATLSLSPRSSTHFQTELWNVEAPVAKKMLSEDRPASCDSSCRLGSVETDVDTSLHL